LSWRQGKAPVQTDIFALTDRESARARIPHSELLIIALKDIVDNKLQAHFTAEPQAGTWPGLIRQAISALERNPHFYVHWFRNIMVEVSVYRCWRETNHASVANEGRTGRRPNRKYVVSKMRNYVESEREKARHVSQKRAWDYAKDAIPAATYRQVIDALRDIEGRKGRGRPRSSPR
jgi:hypothetical protein